MQRSPEEFDTYQDGAPGLWRTGWVVCSICGRRWVAVRPEDTLQNLECPACGHMTGQEDEQEEAAVDSDEWHWESRADDERRWGFPE